MNGKTEAERRRGPDRRLQLRRGTDDTVEVPRATLVEVREQLAQTLEDIGGCDHDAGICACGLGDLIEDVRELLGERAPKEER
jgi:hypothetical protein